MSAAHHPLRLGIEPLPEVGPAALTMGVFDGVHLGHQALLRETVTAARARGLRSVALVFDPHPDEVLRPGTRVPRLAPLAANLRRIEGELGLDLAIPIRFDPALRERTAEEFLAALTPAIELRVIVMSPESAFGRGRGGTVDRLSEIGAASGFEVVTVEPVERDGAAISSMRIREALARGDLAGAAAMGARPLLVARQVADGILEFDYLPALPAPGTYGVLLRSPGAVQEATMIVGEEPPHARLDDQETSATISGPVEIELRDRR